MILRWILRWVGMIKMPCSAYLSWRGYRGPIGDEKSHQQQGQEGRALAGIPENMVRLCVGAEHPTDIIADLDQALFAAKNT